MYHKINISNAFTLEDIRKIRDYYGERYTDTTGKIDWEGLNAETDEKASRVRAEIMRIRSERSMAKQ